MTTTAIEALVQRRLDNLTKPPGSLGRLEELLRTYARIRQAEPPKDPKGAAFIFCADHGIVAQGVSKWPQQISRLMAMNFVQGGAAMSVLCRQHGIALQVIDAGLAGEGTPDHVLARKIAPGTRDFSIEPAMTGSQAEAAIRLGRDTAAEAAAAGYDILLGGEMGIGNTTPATALLCAYSGCSPLEVTGPGAGLDAAGVQHKAQVIERALALHRPQTPLATAATFGGFEILAIAGVILEAHTRRIPVLLDGFISCSAALIVQAVQAEALDVVLYAHRSAEPGHRRMLDSLGARPLFDLDMRLGEGTGAALAFNLLQSACRLYHEMATLDSVLP